MNFLRGRVRFSLRTLLLAMTGLCIVLTLVAQPVMEQRRQHALVDEVAALGGRISNYGTIARGWSPARAILALFDTSYDQFQLINIDLSGTKIDDGDLAMLPKIHHVKELNLGNTAVSDLGLKQLANLEYLTKLALAGTQVTDRGMKYLAGLNDLVSLRVVNTAVSYDVLEALDAKLPYANFCEEKAFEELKAAGIQVVGSHRLAEGEPARGNWIIRGSPQADFVVVGMNRPITLTRQDVVNLNYLKSLREMTFHSVTLDSTGIQELQALPQLQTLEFWFVNLSDADLKAIGRQTQLEALSINGCDEISAAGLGQLESLQNLRSLRFSDCSGVSQDAVDDLKKSLPNCSVQFAMY
jgi:internalin A